MLCHCVTAANRDRYRPQLAQMHRQRHEVFVDGLGWRELRRPDGLDVDEYDTDDTVYLLALNDEGEVVGSTRMNPTWSRHQLEDGGALRQRFSHMEPPRGPTVWEGSRLVSGFPERYGKDHARATLSVLMAGVQEFCVRRGVTLGVSIFETRAVARLQAGGWETEPLGLPVRYETDRGEGEAISVVWKTGMRFVIRTRQASGIVGPVLFEAPPSWPDEIHPGIPYALLDGISALRSADAQREVMNAVRAALDQQSGARTARLN